MQCANAYSFAIKLSARIQPLVMHMQKLYDMFGLPLRLRRSNAKMFAEHVWKKEKRYNYQCSTSSSRAKRRYAVRGQYRIVMQCANAYPFFFACTTACSCSKKICWLTTLSRFNAKKFAEHVWKKGKDMNYQCSTSSSHAT